MAGEVARLSVVLSEEKREELLCCTEKDPTLWRAEALEAYEQVADELKRVSSRGESRDEVRPHELSIVKGDLDAALRAMAPPEKKPGLSGLYERMKQYYSGAPIERTWAAIHRASGGLQMLYDNDELPAQAMRLRNLVEALPDLKPQLATLVETTGALKSNRATGKTRPMLREIYQEAIGVSESLQIDARGLRNAMLVASGVLAFIVALLSAVHLIDPSIISVCTHKLVDGKLVLACPTGTSSRPIDVVVIALAGLLGGVLSIVIPLATGERIKTPYRVFNHQLMLKTIAGAGTAIAGVILVESGLIPGFKVENSAELLGYAILFGFAQQAFTGMIDRRANSLARATPATKGT